MPRNPKRSQRGRPPKVPPPITRAEFRGEAKPVQITVEAGVHLKEPKYIAIAPKQFATGTLGWHGRGVVHLEINGAIVITGVEIRMYVQNSKLLPGHGSTPRTDGNAGIGDDIAMEGQ